MRTITALAIAGAITTTAAAGPINPKHVPDDATWVAHVDLDALRTSRLLGSIDEINEAFDEINEQIADEFGLDLQADLAGVTAFGHGELGDEDDLDGVILYGSAGLQELIKLIEQEAPDHRRRAVADGFVYEFEIDDDEAFASLRVNIADSRMPAGAAISPWTLHVAPTRGKLARLDEIVADGAGDNDLAHDAPRGAMVYISASNLDQIVGEHGGDDPASRFLSAAESLTISISEDDDDFVFFASLVTADEQTASDIKTMANGFLAMARIAAAGEPEAQAILELSKDLTIDVDGRTVELSLIAPIDTIAETIQQLDGQHDNVRFERHGDDEVRIEKNIRLERQ